MWSGILLGSENCLKMLEVQYLKKMLSERKILLIMWGPSWPQKCINHGCQKWKSLKLFWILTLATASTTEGDTRLAWQEINSGRSIPESLVWNPTWLVSEQEAGRIRLSGSGIRIFLVIWDPEGRELGLLDPTFRAKSDSQDPVSGSFWSFGIRKVGSGSFGWWSGSWERAGSKWRSGSFFGSCLLILLHIYINF